MELEKTEFIVLQNAARMITHVARTKGVSARIDGDMAGFRRSEKTFLESFGCGATSAE
jgi:hypothetical protein